jgi:hypothetical protein
VDPSIQPIPSEQAVLQGQQPRVQMPVLTGMAADPNATPQQADSAMKYDNMMVTAGDDYGNKMLDKLYARRTDLKDTRKKEKTASANSAIETLYKKATPSVAAYLHDTLKNHAAPDPVGEKYANWTYLQYQLGFGHPAERASRRAYEKAAKAKAKKTVFSNSGRIRKYNKKSKTNDKDNEKVANSPHIIANLYKQSIDVERGDLFSRTSGVGAALQRPPGAVRRPRT